MQNPRVETIEYEIFQSLKIQNNKRPPSLKSL